ncbi:MAG: DUF4878 domain-containing protein [Eubacteriales bacterium]
MRKLISLLLILTLVLLTIGCSSQANPETAVKNYLEAVKEFDVDTMNSLMAKPEEDDFQEMLEDEGEMATYFMNYIKNNAKKIEYEIINMKIEDDTAKVDVKAKFINGSPLIIETFGELFKNLMTESFSGNELSEEETEMLIIEIMEEKSQEIETKFVENQFTIDLVKKDNNWYLEKVSDELTNVVTANFFKAFDEINKSFN